MAIAVENIEHEIDVAVLISARKAAGLTQRQAAEKAGMDAIHICRIENEWRTTLDTIKRLCKLYNVDYRTVLKNPASICPES